MSGVGVTGLIANLPGTVTPYPTQDPSLELGGCREVADAAARDAIFANFRAIGMLVTLQDTGVTYQAVGGITNAHWKVFTGAGFVATYYVDPTFTGIHTGSESNPFVSIAAAFAYAATLGITTGIIFVPPNQTLSENIVFPSAAGTNWEIACQVQFGEFTATLSGTINLSCVGSGERALTNLVLSGAITGLTGASSTSYVRFGACYTVTTVTLTAGAAGVWHADFVGNAPSGVTGDGGASQANVVVTGTVLASDWYFANGVTFSSGCEFYTCRIFGGLTNTSAAPNVVRLLTCNCLGGPFVLTGGAGGMSVHADGFSISTMLGALTTTVNTVQIFPFDGLGNSIRSTLSANAGVFTLCNRYPTSQMVVRTTLTLLVAGTAGAIQCVITYTDLTGVLRTVNVGGTLNVSGAAGTEVTGEFLFSQNGASNVTLQTAGITTAGALSYSLSGSIQVTGS